MIDEKAVIKDIQEWSKEREIKWTTESVIALLEAAPSLGDLRPCKVTIVRDIVVGLLGIKEEKEEHNAYFHRWNVDTTDEGDILSAVVEYEDGSIHFVNAVKKNDERLIATPPQNCYNEGNTNWERVE